MIKNKTLIRCALAVLAMAATAPAAVILDTTGALTAGDPTQLGRLARDGVASDWSVSKAFPGVTNANTTYRYTTFTVNVGITPYIQINFDDPTGVFFSSAYLGSYLPNPVPANRGLDTNYLGDDGSSGNPFSNPSYFQVVVPANQNLVIVVNETTANGGIGLNYGLQIEGFMDTSFTEPPASGGVPEPSTVLLSGAALALLAVRGFQRQR